MKALDLVDALPVTFSILFEGELLTEVTFPVSVKLVDSVDITGI
jgi:hypothetical protein